MRKKISVSKLKVWLIIFLLNLTHSLAYAKQTIVFAIDIIRHGDRTPTMEIPNDPYDWQEGLGELTNLGMQQEFNLGKKLRTIYIDQYRLLPKNYNSSNLFIRSTDLNRTLMSAQSVLFGLYPLATNPLLSKRESITLPMRCQPMPVHTVSQTEDSLLMPGHNQLKFKALISKYVISSLKWQEKLIQYHTKLQRWSSITGVTIKDLEEVIPVGDNLYIRMLHKVAMPKGINNQDRDELISLTNWAVSNIYAPYEVGSYASKELRALIAENLQSTIKTGSTKLKYILFSAHDSTLMAILSAFRRPLQSIPPYASDLRILLIKDETNNYYVQLQFNGKDLTLTNCEKYCNLENFMNYLK